jgi:LysR family positive regulator for ilvC
MDTRQLHQFVTLAETLHFGRASELCHISASALSRNIRQLETESGVSLFDRDNRSVALTSAGASFLRYARESLAQWELIRNQLMEESGELRGEVAIYCSVTASYSFLYELLSQFRAEHSGVEVKLHTGDPEYAIQRVQAGAEDIAIGARPDRMPAGLSFKPMAKTPLVFIAARNHPEWLPAKGRRDAEAWAAVPMILSERGLARSRVDAWFKSKKIQPTIYAQVAGNEAIVSMVSLGFGVGVLPQIVLDNSPLADKVTVLDVRPQLTAYDVGLLTLEKKLRNPIIRALWEQLK